MKLSGTRGVALTKVAVAAGLIALVAMVAPVASSATTSRVPGATRSVHASLIRSTAVVRWRPPASDGGSPITHYRAVSRPSGLSCTTEGTSCDIAQLRNKTTYRFTVEALNRYGSGPNSSASNAVTVNTTVVVVVPPAPPSPPTTTTTVPSGGGGGGGGSPPPTSYTVTFSANGGTGSMSGETESSSTALASNSFTNAGYSFSGWNTLANGTGTPYANGASYSFSSSITLYAQWTALPDVTVTFNANGGTGSMAAETGNAAAALTTNAFARTGYTFAGWSTTANGSLAYANGATYPFTASVTLYALWAQEFIVAFNANGGTGSMANETNGSPTALTSNTFTRSGYNFSDWNTAANGSGTSYANNATYPFTASVTLYAQWASIFTVTFNANGGTGSMTNEAESSATALTLNDFTRAGYNFSGWNTSSNGSGTPYSNGATYPFTASATLYAQWTAAPSYTVTFNGNGQSGSMSPEIENSPTALTSNTFSPTFGYVFSGWNTVANGSGVTYANGATYSFSASITLYAQWLAIQPSNNWTGYVDTGGAFSGVSGNWVVPTVSCTETAYSSEWVGIDGGTLGDDTVEQDGTEADCGGTTGTTPVYDAWYEMYGDDSVNGGDEVKLPTGSYPVAPGNAMSGSVNYASGTWTLAITDATAGWSYSIPIAAPSPPPSQLTAEWIMETPEVCNPNCGLQPLPDFGSTTFTNASVTSNGTVGTVSANSFSASATVNGSDVLMIPGQLNDNGTSFVITWDASS